MFRVIGIGTGVGRTEGATAPPTKLLGEQLVHPAPTFFGLIIVIGK